MPTGNAQFFELSSKRYPLYPVNVYTYTLDLPDRTPHMGEGFARGWEFLGIFPHIPIIWRAQHSDAVAIRRCLARGNRCGDGRREILHVQGLLRASPSRR